MLTRDEFIRRFSSGVHLLDGATGTELWKAGMPRNVCPEQWILEHPQPLLALQQAYASAGSEIIYAPTFRAQPMALSKWNLAEKAESINRELVALSRKAAPGCLVAGDITTMHGCIDPGQEDGPRQMKAAYLRQMEALIAAGADLLVAETLMDSAEALAVLELAKGPDVPAVMVSFTCRNADYLWSGETVAEAFEAVEKAGAAAIGVNCVAASDELPDFIAKVRARTALPVICKPNAGIPSNGKYPVGKACFASILLDCVKSGAVLVGGCCGTTPEYIRLIREYLDSRHPDNPAGIDTRRHP